MYDRAKLPSKVYIYLKINFRLSFAFLDDIKNRFRSSYRKSSEIKQYFGIRAIRNHYKRNNLFAHYCTQIFCRPKRGTSNYRILGNGYAKRSNYDETIVGYNSFFFKFYLYNFIITPNRNAFPFRQRV